MQSILFGAFAVALGARPALSNEGYEAFRQKYRHHHAEAHDPVDFSMRLALFEARRQEVDVHNARLDTTWAAEVNKFADYTEAERRALLGYKRMGHLATGSSSSSASFLEVKPFKKSAASSVDWGGLNSSKFFRQQGGCGSCWAVAAVGALEMHAEITQKKLPKQLSFEQLVDCVPNPRNCGGTGGCKGATAELAFQYVHEHGLTDADAYPGGYTTENWYKDGSCKGPSVTASVASQGFVSLPVNELLPLLQALSTKGPVVVSVDASEWSMYSNGVFQDCAKDATINHAVLAVGYGQQGGYSLAQTGSKTTAMDYFLIRNSWGADWGDGGHIKILRHSSDKGDAGHCGTDYKPQEGVGCDGGPATLPVCGMCGILSDSAYPTGVSMKQA